MLTFARSGIDTPVTQVDRDFWRALQCRERRKLLLIPTLETSICISTTLLANTLTLRFPEIWNDLPSCSESIWKQLMYEMVGTSVTRKSSKMRVTSGTLVVRMCKSMEMDPIGNHGVTMDGTA